MGFLSGKWSFYVNGVLLAVFIVLCLYLFNDTIGMGNGMVVFSEYCQKVVKEQSITEPPVLSWQTGFLGGIFIGALAAALICGNWKIRFFAEKEGGLMTTAGKTILFNVLGGFLVMLGLQLAGDSFFGQWAAAIQLSAGSWIFLITAFFISCVTALLLDRRKEGKGGEEKK